MVAPCLQEWLFFGLLKECFGTEDPLVDFVQIKTDQQRIVSTSCLEQLCKNWAEPSWHDKLIGQRAIAIHRNWRAFNHSGFRHKKTAGVDCTKPWLEDLTKGPAMAFCNSLKLAEQPSTLIIPSERANIFPLKFVSLSIRTLLCSSRSFILQLLLLRLSKHHWRSGKSRVSDWMHR